MINEKEFIKRLQKIMSDYSLSPSTLADKLEVGRSSISHILSGRNKPSLDFILKIDQAFPDIDLEWLLKGIENAESSNSFSERNSPNLSEITKKSASNSPKPNPAQKTGNSSYSSEKAINKIIILYKDGSFEAFENAE